MGIEYSLAASFERRAGKAKAKRKKGKMKSKVRAHHAHSLATRRISPVSPPACVSEQNFAASRPYATQGLSKGLHSVRATASHRDVRVMVNVRPERVAFRLSFSLVVVTAKGKS